MTIIRGTPSIGFSNVLTELPTLPAVGLTSQEIIDDLVAKFANLTTLVEGKADANKIRTLIAYSDEGIFIKAQDIVLAGTVTIADIINDQNGTQSGEIAQSITQIVGNKIRTGSITSNEWGDTQGTYIGLDDDVIVMGGLLNPSLIFTGGNLTISGTLTAGSFVQGKATTLGEMVDDIAALGGGDFNAQLDSALALGVGNVLMGNTGDFVLEVTDTAIYARHDLFDETGLVGGYTGDLRSGVILTGAGLAMGYNDKTDGSFVAAIAIDATGNVAIKGTLIAGSIIAGTATVDGISMTAIKDGALSGGFTETDLQAILDAGVGNIIAGDAGNYGLVVNGTSVSAKHNLANNAGLGASYVGDLRTGLFVTANGIAMGYNRKVDGVWVDSVSINSTGDAAFIGAVTATSGSFTGTLTADSVITGSVTVDGVTMTAIKDAAFAGGGFTEAELQVILDGGVGNIIAGDGGDYTLSVTNASVIAAHSLANISGLGAGYAGDLRTGLIVNANGIGMGHNRKSDGAWINAISIDSLGNAAFLGAVTATSGSFTGTLTAASIISGSATIGGVALDTIKTNAAVGQSHSVAVGNPHGTSLAVMAGDLDDIADGSSYYKTNVGQWQGANRAANALDASNDYIRAITTTKIVVTGANPANGVVFDTNGLRGYSGGVLKFNVSTSGTAYFSGDISGASGTFSGNLVSSGQIKGSGSTTESGYGNFAIVARPLVSSVNALLAYSISGIGAIAYSDNNTGVQGGSGNPSYPGVDAYHNGGGYGLRVSGKGIQRTKNLTGVLSVWDIGTNTLQGQFYYQFD